LEVRQHSGETLNQIVDTLSEKLSFDFASLNLFNSKLIEAGYFENHKHLYDNTGYYIRHELFYKVEKDFPRIEEKEIRSGVGDVKYSIVISQCSEFLKSENDIFNTINVL
jgi:hypothetical protein